MLRKHILCLITAVLAMSGCASSKTRLIAPTIPNLDAALSAPCPQLKSPTDDAVDSLIESYIDAVGKYSDCSKRHDATVKAWQQLRKGN